MLFNIKNRNKHKITEDISWRLYVAENLARVYSELHNSNYFVIDTKPANIRAYKSVPGVALLDCDGFKLEGTSFDGEHLTRDYIAPEIYRRSTTGTRSRTGCFCLICFTFSDF